MRPIAARPCRHSHDAQRRAALVLLLRNARIFQNKRTSCEIQRIAYGVRAESLLARQPDQLARYGKANQTGETM